MSMGLPCQGLNAALVQSQQSLNKELNYVLCPGELNTSFISLIPSLPHLYRLLEKCPQYPHIFLTKTLLERTSPQVPSVESKAFNINELSLNSFQLNCKKPFHKKKLFQKHVNTKSDFSSASQLEKKPKKRQDKKLSNFTRSLNSHRSNGIT